LYALYWDIVMDWGMMQDPQAVVTHTCISTSNFVGVGGTMAGTHGGRGGGGGAIAIDSSLTVFDDDDGDEYGSKGSGTGNGGGGGGITRHRSGALLGGGLRNRPSPSCHRIFLRPRLRFGVTMSTMIVLSDAVLRFSWLLRFVSKAVFPTDDAFVLCTQFLEVFRRAIWNLLRVEWEHIKQQSKKVQKSRDSLSDHEDDDSYGNNNGGRHHLHHLHHHNHHHRLSSPSEQEMVGLLHTTPSSSTTTTPITTNSTMMNGSIGGGTTTSGGVILGNGTTSSSMVVV